MKISEKYNEFLDHLRMKGYKEKSVSEQRRFMFGSLSHSIQDIAVEDLKITDADKVIEAGKHHGFYGAQRSVCCFRNYLKFLKDSGVKLPFDWRDVKVPKVPMREQPVFEVQEMFNIFEAFPINSNYPVQRKMSWTMRAVCEVAFGTGMRACEFLSLRQEDFKKIKDYRELAIIGKGGDERTVFFPDRSILWLEKYLKQRQILSWAMFTNAFGDPLTYGTAKKWIDTFKKNNPNLPSIEKLRFHTLRRTLGSCLSERNADLKSVQNILGHKSERTTLRCYIRVNKTHAKEVHSDIMNSLSQNTAVDNF